MNEPCYVIIPNWNGIDMIEECLEALRRQTLAHTVIVVDNGSVDGSNDVVREKYPEVQLLEFPNNAGFAGGVNRGIAPALVQGAAYVVLLNNDAVADEHWLEELVAVAEADETVGIVAAKIVTQDGKKIDSTGDFYSVWGFPYPRGPRRSGYGAIRRRRHARYICGVGGRQLVPGEYAARDRAV